MARQLQHDLETIERELLSLSAMTEEMIAKACIALSHRDASMALEVVAMDQEVDLREVEIEEECLKILAIRQPLGKDLRRTTAILRINNDLERIGDLAVNIAQVAQRLMKLSVTGFASPPIPADLEQMASLARGMVSGALDAFIQLNVELATEVCKRDDAVDQLQDEINQQMLDRVMQSPSEASGAFQLMQITHNLERIADHATNIAEDALYLVDGRIARHRRHKEHKDPHP